MFRHTTSKFISIVTLLAMCTGCKTTTDGSQTSVVGGQPVLDGSKVERSTVIVLNESSLCTGTIIGKKTVLTAAHCVDELPAGSKVAVSFGADLQDNIGDHFPDGRNDEKIIKGRFHYENFIKRQTPAYPSYVVHDWALIFLDREIPAGYVPVPLASNQRMTNGMPLISAGFGRTSIDGSNSNTKLHAIGSALYQQNRIAKEFEVTFGGRGRGAHSGDSGGPTFMTLANGNLVVVGVTSRASVQVGKSVMTDVRLINARIKTLMASHEGGETNPVVPFTPVVTENPEGIPASAVLFFDENINSHSMTSSRNPAWTAMTAINPIEVRTIHVKSSCRGVTGVQIKSPTTAGSLKQVVTGTFESNYSGKVLDVSEISFQMIVPGSCNIKAWRMPL